MADYTPGHALTDISAAVDMSVDGARDFYTQILTRLYKAGQANERAAIVAGLRARGGAKGDPWGVHAAVADIVERSELS